MKKKFLICLAAVMVFAASAYSQVNARLFQYPDVSDSHIAFVYGGDIWVVAKTGGTAVKLSSPAGTESMPRFSQDGKTIAFSGNYDGNLDVYTVPVAGGPVKRITYHGMPDRMLDWFPGDKAILFASFRTSERLRYRQFFKISPEGGLAEKLPIPYGEFASVSPDGSRVAYTKRTRLFRTWKRYRGGMAANIWIFNLKTGKTEKVTDNNANNELPMWNGNRIFYLSDRGPNKRFNIWVHDMAGGKDRQVTDFSEFDVHFPAVGPEEMVFEARGGLYLLDLASLKYKEVKINVVSDLANLKQTEKNVAKNLVFADISPHGKRIVAEARGELFSVPAEHGYIKNITRRCGSAQRYPAWSPDGKKIAFWSDESGEYQLSLYDVKAGTVKTLTEFRNGYRYRMYWSPDSSKIAFIDQAMKIHVFDLKLNRLVFVDQALWKMHGALANFKCSWSPDSRWLAYARGLENRKSAVFLFNVATGKSHQVTSGYYSSASPAFDPGGEYLYFTSDRNFRPVYSDMEGTWIYPNSTSLAAVALRGDVKSPLYPRNDQVELKKKEKPAGNSKKNSKNGEKKEKPLKIDLQGFERRAVILPVKPGNIANVFGISGAVIFQRFPNRGSGNRKAAINIYTLKDRKEEVVAGDVNAFVAAADGKNLLAVSHGKLYIIKAAKAQKLKKPVNTGNLCMTVNPRAEWTQILRESWRLQRDYFYDPNMHGVNWKKIYKQYAALAKHAISREDINYILGEMIGELSSSHSYRGGGDIERGRRRNVGYLGVDWELKDNAFRIAKIIRGAEWDNEARSPLDQPGLEVREGEYILAVNGVPVNTSRSPYAAFQGLADQTVELTVNSAPVMEGARTLVVKTLRSEARLRHLAWIEKNRLRVDQATNGKIGYIYVRSTGIDGQNELTRQFYAQFHKQGLIIDERFNSGGQIPDRFIELLNRKPLAFWAVRDGKTWQHPVAGNFGPKVMLINGWSGSGGDAFPHYFRLAKLGPLVGTRTWGGLIGISGAPAFIDGGGMTVPTFRMYDPDGKWFPEGHGVEPDIEVEDDAARLSKGVDPQLEAAIKEVMRLLKKNPPPAKIDPPYEKR